MFLSLAYSERFSIYEYSKLFAENYLKNKTRNMRIKIFVMYSPRIKVQKENCITSNCNFSF